MCAWSSRHLLQASARQSPFSCYAARSQMDVPTRTSYVMSMVPKHERPAAASVTAVPRSLAAAVSPMLSGALLAISTFGWPLILAGGLKIAYDLLLLILYRKKPLIEDT
jgi:hypothetical protein